MRLVWLLVLCLGCRQIFGLHEVGNTDAPGVTGDGVVAGDAAGDGRGNVSGDGGDASSGLCFGPGDWQVCLGSMPTANVTLTDTTTSPSCANPNSASWTNPTTQPTACFVVGKTITVDATVRVTGTVPLVLVATDTIMISGTLDASSDFGSGDGPGADPSACSEGTDPTTNGGGAGGSFWIAGANGGSKGSNTGGIAAEGGGSRPAALRGGCRGQSGNPGGSGGNGGGAVYLVAANITITSTGTINASGAGGSGGSMSGCAGGGGSGGMIVLAASAISASEATLFADGGGGGGGGSDTNYGDPGLRPTSATAHGTAGQNQLAGGNGYSLGFGAIPGSSTSTSSMVYAGGGGGGGGYVAANQSLSSAAYVSPPPGSI